MWQGQGLPEKRPGETTGEDAASVAVAAPRLKGSWKEVEARHHDSPLGKVRPQLQWKL